MTWSGPSDTPLTYSQSNGTPELRGALSEIYPGTTIENFEVTNGTSEANYLVPLTLLQEGDGFALEVPNYMQLWGVPRSMGAEVSTFQLLQKNGWEPDWEEFERAVTPKTRWSMSQTPTTPRGRSCPKAPWNGS